MADTSSQVRLRVRYKKDGRLAYLGHLEVLGTINRSIRRSGVPFAVGNGFARRIRLQFSQALPVGASSTGEYYDLMLTRRLDPSEALTMLEAATPSGLAPNAATYVSRKLPALEAWLNRASWEVRMPSVVTADDLDSTFSRLRDAGELHYMRGERQKSIDLGSALVGWDVSTRGEDLLVLLDTRSSNDGSLRPQILIDTALSRLLPADGDGAARHVPLRVCRTGQWHEGEDGNLVKPLPTGAE
ncbi:MAG: TIGR03936 family radical SAM-associated protein [Parafannyhessea sp.]|uniref:TIGR03936 family radical SAM-associated protein n=1 Tax=Parafannyhessea sp. TaxID=2847324 RepID=UPI003F06C9EB